MALHKSRNEDQFGKLAFGIESLHHSDKMKDVCQDHELERHAGFSSQLKSEVHGLEGQFACFVDKTAKLEEELQNFTQMTILKCSEVMNRKRNLAFINIPED